MNLEHCVDIKDMTAQEAAESLKTLAEEIKGPLGIGIWEGVLRGKISGVTHEGKHIAVFQDNALIAPFGPHGDAESEACAALFVLAVKYASKIAEALAL